MAKHLSIEAAHVPLDVILRMREEYRREMDRQIVHDSWHERGFMNSYLLSVAGQIVGYGSVGGAPREAKETIKEFFVFPPFRGAALPLFRELAAVSGARRIEAQTNDTLLLLMLYDCAVELSSETILFADGVTTDLTPPGCTLRRVTETDGESLFPHTLEPVGEWGLECNREIAATGGLLFHYNPPFGDIFVEVADAYRRKGFGSYLVQELKRLCHEMGCVPAARCNQANLGSRLALQRAGMFPCARIVRGRLAVQLTKTEGREGRAE